MHIRTGIMLAAVLVVCVSPNAMAQSIALNDEASFAASQDVSPRAPSRSMHLQHRHSRNAGLATDGYAPGSGPQAPDLGYVPGGVTANNYQNWHQACCL